MLGDASVGKTCIVNRFIKNSFASVDATLAQDFKSKALKIVVDGVQASARLQIWDTAGGEQYRSLTPIYYKNAHCFCLVYDSTSPNSFDALKFWVSQIKDQVKTKYCMFLIAAKIDLSEQELVSVMEANEYAKDIGASLA